MKKPLLIKYFLPFIQWYALVIFIAIGIDFIVHQFDLIFIGRYLGICVTIVILLSFRLDNKRPKLNSINGILQLQ